MKPARSAPHILVINGTKVRRPVFIVGAPHSGAGLLAAALKRSAGFHLTMGRPGVLRVTYAFARRPSIASGRGQGAARVLRDAYAQAWQISPRGCLECPRECRELGGRPGPGPCVEDVRGTHRYADASPDLLYSTDVLFDAFPDAQLLQIIRDGRDVVADMLDDEQCLAWFKPGVANLDEVFPNPFLGVEDATERARWPIAATAVKCALRWRGSVRLSARLRAQTPEDQLYTVRFEDLVSRPARVIEGVADYLGTPVTTTALAGIDGRGVAVWRDRLTQRQVTQVERIAGAELRRLGYRPAKRLVAAPAGHP
ncbi:MAG TPA: sulfotransferase [Streptosporangiaceae bacterium]|nr:sulfotransferase [Streptosporangiaceae bacterium]